MVIDTGNRTIIASPFGLTLSLHVDHAVQTNLPMLKYRTLHTARTAVGPTSKPITVRMSSTVSMKKKKWHVPASKTAKETFNPIRAIVDTMKIKPNPDKKMIALSIGDPTVFGNLEPPEEMIDAVIKSAKAGTNNGYAPSTGYLRSKEAVAKFCSVPNAEVEVKDVIFASGCSNALEMAIDVLVNPGDNILLPLPGFSIYQTISVSRGHEVHFYNLLPEKSWEVDLDHLESVIDSKTRAIIVNNPSNPCGSVYTREHLEAILEVVVLMTVFPGQKFHALASLSKNVPILTCGAISKRFLVPGWRLGWILVHDRNGAFEDEVKPGLVSLSQQILGPNTIIQAALPDILENTPRSFYENAINVMQKNAKLLYEDLHKIPELNPIMPCGAMYMMVS
ncbi:tyrosine aminotransferase-like [Actinia tenebrosa]|uniref:Tyrosine aminotransferase n=1 Tax=Actinia tenebrosa TaxID=6105 RepID=A0A6P8H657_ACTTE|nr:tyrosine aminotransferase-like [Actinia tenebrosa]